MLNTRVGELYNANNVINSNDLRKRIINVDSRFRSNLADPTTNFSYSCEHVYKNLIRLKVSSLEIPNTLYVFSQNRGNTNFTIKAYDINNVVRTLKVDIPEGNYTETELINQIQTALDTGFRDAFGIFIRVSLNTINRKVTFTNLGTSTLPPPAEPTAVGKLFVLDFQSDKLSVRNRSQDFGLGYNLGFRKKLYRVADTIIVDGIPCYSVTSETCINVSGDTYMFLCVNDLHCVEQKMREDYLQCLAKIIIKQDTSSVVYDGTCCLTNEIIFPSPVDLRVLNVRLLDIYGEVVNLCDNNFSFSLEITEVLNTSLYDFYRNYIWMGTIPSVPYRTVVGSAQPLLRGVGPPF